MAMRQRAVRGDEITFVVIGRDWNVVGPAEEFLEHLRCEGYSPHTVRAYAHGLALWWSMIEDRGVDWRAIDVNDLARFKKRLKNRGGDPDTVALHPVQPPSASSVNAALTAVLSFYRFHALAGGVPAAQGFYEQVHGGPGLARSRYASFLGHIAGNTDRRVVGRRRDAKSPPPFLDPRQIEVIKNDAAQFDNDQKLWVGDLRMRLFWTLLEETGLRIAEALLLRHRDWHPGRGDTAVIEVQPRQDSRRRLRVKNQHYRRIYVGDDLDDLYGEYLFQLIEMGMDLDDDDPVFVNLYRGVVGDPLRPESVYDWIAGFKKRHPLLPAGWTPHWFRHTHATALLLAGVPEHVVQRRLGHSDITTLLTTYAHVTEDAAMRTAGDWKTLVNRWGATV